MKIFGKIIGLISLLIYLSTPSFAIENGDDATGSGFVVPILFQLSANSYGACSGALIAPRIVVTAGHCVLDADGLLTKNVFVGLAGSPISSVSKKDIVQSVQITSSFQNSANGKVGDDDLAFLTLVSSQPLKIPIYLASEKQTTDMKNSGAVLKAYGYGDYDDNAAIEVSTPKSMSGSYSPFISKYSNSAYMASTKSDTCQGDSGGPVLNITATQVTLVGIITGASLSVHCTKKESDGSYLTLFTLIGRYANLAFASATDVMNSEEQMLGSYVLQLAEKDSQINLANSKTSTLTSDLSTAQDSMDLLTQNVSDLQQELDAANATISTLRSKIPTAINCVKGKIVQKVLAVNPKCPKGFQLKL